jgi:paraquat-inducible protein A
MVMRGAIACEHCDTVHRRESLPGKGVAECVRCGSVLYRGRGLDLDAMLALSVAGLITFVIANAYPIVTLEARGQRTEATVWKAVQVAQEGGVGPVAVVAALTVFLFPLLQLTLYIWTLVPLRAGRVPPGFVDAMHALRLLRPWSMVEVFLLGVLVSVVKLASLASVSMGAGLWGFGALTMLLAALGSFELRELWHRAEESRR